MKITSEKSAGFTSALFFPVASLIEQSYKFNKGVNGEGKSSFILF